MQRATLKQRKSLTYLKESCVSLPKKIVHHPLYLAAEKEAQDSIIFARIEERRLLQFLESLSPNSLEDVARWRIVKAEFIAYLIKGINAEHSRRKDENALIAKALYVACKKPTRLGSTDLRGASTEELRAIAHAFYQSFKQEERLSIKRKRRLVPLILLTTLLSLSLLGLTLAGL